MIKLINIGSIKFYDLLGHTFLWRSKNDLREVS